MSGLCSGNCGEQSVPSTTYTTTRSGFIHVEAGVVPTMGDMYKAMESLRTIKKIVDKLTSLRKFEQFFLYYDGDYDDYRADRASLSMSIAAAGIELGGALGGELAEFTALGPVSAVPVSRAGNLLQRFYKMAKRVIGAAEKTKKAGEVISMRPKLEHEIVVDYDRVDIYFKSRD